MNHVIPIRHEKPIHGTNMAISIKTHWKQLPPILHELKRHDCSIHKAKYWHGWTSMYIKSPTRFKPDEVDRIVHESTDCEPTLYTPSLPLQTTIYIYNISTLPFTVLDFGCVDRKGLFCEILEVLSKYDIDVKGAYINTIGNVVSNIFYITYKGDKLTVNYIEYIRNNMETEVKTQESDSY